MDLVNFVGEHILTGVAKGLIDLPSDMYADADSCSCLDFILDDNVFSAVEDPSDGYRSCLGQILVDRNGCHINKFVPHKVRGAFRSTDRNSDVIEFTDVLTNKIVLSIGTDNTNDYYPYYVAEWLPENLAVNDPSIDMTPIIERDPKIYTRRVKYIPKVH